MVYEIPHWSLDRPVRIAQSASKVPVTTHPDDNLVRGSTSPWPPPELQKKLCRSPRFRGATPEDDNAARSGMGFYCDLQSLNSEDAMTWSVFGTLSHLPQAERQDIYVKLFSRLELDPPSEVTCRLWRRLPHPEKPGSKNGPEIDFAFLTDSVSILGEAKWNAAIGIGQGIKKNRSQLDLRLAYCVEQRAIPDIKQFVVLGVGRTPGLLGKPTAPPDGVTVLSLVWEEVVGCFEDPLREELNKYLQWRDTYGAQAFPKTDSQEPVVLEWHRFERLTLARLKFSKTPCVYIQADQAGHPVRVGMASYGLEARYRGGTGYAIDAAMHTSNNLVFIAAVQQELCKQVETELIWQGRQCLAYNNQGKLSVPLSRIPLIHTGLIPVFERFMAIHNDQENENTGGAIDGPLT